MSNKLLSTVLCHNVLIRRSGQQVSLQINIPPDVTRIVGIETGIRNMYCRALMPWQRDHPAGLLTLQATGSTNLCYSSHLKVEQNTVLAEELGYRYWVTGFWADNWLLVSGAFHTASHEPDTLDIPAPRVLLCNYTDHWGPYMLRNITYRVSIYLWVTVNDLYNTPEQCTAG